jgi:hypothetical protein
MIIRGLVKPVIFLKRKRTLSDNLSARSIRAGSRDFQRFINVA